MVEELKLAIKVDDDAIEQALLKQFANAEKMANKVVLTFNNIDLDNKAIEAKFKEMQKIAGKNPIDLSIDKSSIEMLSAISKQLGNIFDIAKGKSIIDSSATVSEINKITKATENLANAQKNVGNKSNISSEMKDVFQGGDKSATDASTTAIKEESKALEQVSTSAKEASESKEKFAKANKEVKASADSSKTSISEEEKYFNSLGNAIKSYDNTLTSISRKPADGNRSKELQDKIDIISSSLVELRTLESNASKDGYVFNKEDVERGQQLEKIIKNNIELVKQMSAAEKGSTESARWKEIDKISKYLEKNTKISKEAKQQLQGYIALLKSGENVNIETIHMQFNKIAEAERVAGREGKNFFDIFSTKVLYNAASQLATYYLSLMDIIRYGRNAFNAVRELDTALVDLKKTTTMSNSELERFYFDANDIAKQMGVTTAEIINQASAWSRLGFSTKEASTQMAELSAQFASISPDMDLDTATDGLVSSMKAFDIEVSNVERDIMDNINRIGNTAATSNGEIVDMLTRSSAAMAAANNTIQETIALETAAVEITRNAETTGTAFKTKFCLYVQKCAYRKYLIAGNA